MAIKSIIPVAYTATQADINAGLANNLPKGTSVIIVDANQQPIDIKTAQGGGQAPTEGSGLKNNFAATTAPAVTNDSSQGYSIGSRWIDTVGDESYICLDATANAAVWSKSTVGTISEVSGLQGALDGKAPLASPTFTGTVAGITKAMVGLGSVDNVADISKPISTAQQTALDGKQATLVSGTTIKTVDGQSLVGSGNLAPTILIVTAPIAIRLTGATGAGVNYQTKLTIGESSGATGANFNISTAAGTFPAGKNGTCSFLFWDTVGVVPFWIEKVTGTTPNRVAHVWLRPNIDLSSGTQTVFLTTAATNLIRSDGISVFTLFDDFDGTSLDATKWDTSVMTGDSYSGSVLSFGGGNVARRLRTLNIVGDGFEVMSLLRASDTSASYVAFGWDSVTTAEIYKFENGWNTAARINVAGATTNLTTDINNGVGVRQLMRIARAGGIGRFSSENPANTLNSASGVPTVAIATTIFNTYDNATEIDWVALKKFVATEPAFLSAVM